MPDTRRCPDCAEAVRPVVRDDFGPKCPLCAYRFHRPDPDADMNLQNREIARWLGVPEGAHYV